MKKIIIIISVILVITISTIVGYIKLSYNKSNNINNIQSKSEIIDNQNIDIKNKEQRLFLLWNDIMLNNLVLVGRITQNPEMLETEKGNKRTVVTVSVPRSFKNSDGLYDTDFIKCTLWNTVAEHTFEYCKKGDVVGIKGRLQNNNYEKDGKMHYELEVVAERITFLQSRVDRENER